MNTKEINDIISQNKDNIAFLIGNGIHYQYKDSDESWKDLLIDLWKKFVSNEIDIPKGISLTEFYDIIELNYFKCKPDYTDLFNKLKNSEKLLQTYNEIDFNKVQKNIDSLAIYGKPFDIKNVNQERLLDFNKTLKSSDDKLKK